MENKIPCIEEYIEREVLPEERLLIAVLDAAIVDLFSENKLEKAAAIRWFKHPGLSLPDENYIAYLDIMEHFDLDHMAEKFYLMCTKNSINARRCTNL